MLSHIIDTLLHNCLLYCADIPFSDEVEIFIVADRPL